MLNKSLFSSKSNEYETSIDEITQYLLDCWTKLDKIEAYASWFIDSLTEDIEDYTDDDKVGNRDIIGELKEERENWKDIIKILSNDDDLYRKDILWEFYDDISE